MNIEEIYDLTREKLRQAKESNDPALIRHAENAENKARANLMRELLIEQAQIESKKRKEYEK